MFLVFSIGFLVFVSGMYAHNSNNGACISSSPKACGPHSHYDDCVTACPRTCENYGKPIEVCNAGCGPGCKCNDGYVKGPSGSCIAPRQCPPRTRGGIIVLNSTKSIGCGPNSHYEQCGSKCPVTCNDILGASAPVCEVGCQPGCQCDVGFYKSNTGRCVTRDQCVVEQSCGANSLYVLCGTNCPLTCDNYQNPPEVCDTGCVSRCQCIDGYVQASNGKCVKPEECYVANSCGPHSHYDDCVTACPRTCENYGKPIVACNAGCGPGCKCDDGYVKGPGGKCITPSQCPICGPNAHFEMCGTTCPATCPPVRAPQTCLSCRPSCQCDKGFVIAPNGQCVNPSQCVELSFPSPYDNGYDDSSFEDASDSEDEASLIPEAYICEPNSHYDECMFCQLTCDDYNNGVYACASTSCYKGCKCNPGYYLDRYRRCVLPRYCSARNVY